jgi:NADH-quinone oxidoreductase subunit L
MFDLAALLVLIPALPLAACLATAIFGRRWLRERSHWPTVLATVLSFLCSLLLAAQVQARRGHTQGETSCEYVHVLWTWAAIPADAAAETAQPEARAAAAQDLAASGGRLAVRPFDFRVDVALRADPLSAMMLAMVTFVSALVAIYSAGYMQGDPGYPRFFTYLALFVFSMTMLVAASNFVLLYVFWEAVGLCSYLLIGFWFQKPEAAAAGKKAFLVNRVGDFGFALGVFLLFTTYGTLNFHDVAADGSPAVGREVAVAGVLGHQRVAQADDPGRGYVRGGTALAICLCLLAGACGKSAQFPLHVWLPDAMEGPTPVSALIHAATMVTAGVYMVARCTPLFMAAPEAQAIVACVGGFTALLAAVIALSQTDLKRVLAYSTVSQLGFMFMALGTGTVLGVLAAMFHLLTHAFFKALLFLGAGSVMHAMGGVIDVRRLGGLRQVMPITHATFWFGALALAGVVPFAGFWSKDAILSAVHAQAHGEAAERLLFAEWGGAALRAGSLYGGLYWLALITAGLTAFYTFRALFLTFYGPLRIPPEAGHHAHESPRSMTVPLGILAVCSLLAGAWCEATGGLARFLHQTPVLAWLPTLRGGAAGQFHLEVAAVSTLAALLGMGLAAYLYLGSTREVDYVEELAEGLRQVRPRSPAASALLHILLLPVRWGRSLSIHKFFLDEAYVLCVVRPLEGLAAFCYWLDRRALDGLVDGIGRLPWRLAASLRALQGGLVPFYALAMAIGMLVALGAMLAW